MTMLRYLGALLPAVQTRLEARIGYIEQLHELVYGELMAVADLGEDVSQFRAEADASAISTQALSASLHTMDETGEGAWVAQADALDAKYHHLLARLATARKHGVKSVKVRGAAWGAGSILVALGAVYAVWRMSRKTRRA